VNTGIRMARVPEATAPRLLEQQLLGVARMAVIMLTRKGKVTHWNQAADELFGVDRGRAIGQSVHTLLRLPQEYQDTFAPSGFPHVWCGTCFVPRPDDDSLAEIAWWVYPLEGPGRIRALALAADVRRLREEGPGLAMGDVLVVPPSDRPAQAETGLRVLRVEPTLVPVAGRDRNRLRRPLMEMLPLMEPDTSEQIVAQVLARGYPAVHVGVTVRLPIVPYWGGMPRALRIKPRVATPGQVREPVHPQGRSHPRRAHSEELENMRVRERLAFLSEAGEQVASSLDHIQTSRALAGVLVPRFADFAALQLLEEVVQEFVLPFGELGDELGDVTTVCRVVVVHDDEPGRWDDTVPEGETLVLPPGSPFVESMKSGQSVHIPQVTPELAEQISAQFTDRDLRPLISDRALLIVPLIARGKVFGNLVLMRRSDRPFFDDMDLDMVEELSRRAAMGIDNGRLYRREVRVTQQLQRSMLPTDPPEIAGARVCYRYLPASEAAQVGGDWFDAIPLPGSRLAIVVGDVMGHGLTSAAIMGQLRTAVLTLAAQDLRPDRLLRQLDDLSQRLGEDYIATCLYVVYDPVARRCQLANAGHLPPILVSPRGQSAVVEVPSGVPIGVGDEPFETIEFEVEDDSQLVLCTDGLVERRDRDLDEGLAVLCAQLTGASRSLDVTCDALLAALTPDVRMDDIALLAVGLDGIPPQDVTAWDLSAEPSMVPKTRAMVRERLRDWRLAEISDTVELLVSELVTNALVHGAGEIVLRLIRASTLLCEVRDDGHELPYLCSADDSAESGRGLQFVSFLAERWGTNRTENGKVVWFEHALPELRPSGP
jgi:hypothetical protein